MIPKLIHQTAKTADLDERSRHYQAIVRKLHPEWTYKLWTDEDNDAFVKTEFPEFYPVFIGLPKNIMRADVIRYLLMDKLGGLYLDTDYEMLRPFDLLNHGAVVPFENTLNDGSGNKRLGNAFFAAAPGSSFFREVIRVLQIRPALKADANVLTTTGPAFLTTVYESRQPNEWPDLHTPERELFNPVAPRNQSEYDRLIQTNSIYGIHHCHGSWREYTLSEKLKNFAHKLYHKFR